MLFMPGTSLDAMLALAMPQRAASMLIVPAGPKYAGMWQCSLKRSDRDAYAVAIAATPQTAILAALEQL